MTKQVLIDSCLECPYKIDYPIPGTDAIRFTCDLTGRQVPTVGIDSECPLDEYTVV